MIKFSFFVFVLFIAACSKKVDFYSWSNTFLQIINEEKSKHFLKEKNLQFENEFVDTFKFEDEILKVQNLDNLNEDINHRILLLKTMFESQNVPYQGTISKNSSCLSQNSTIPIIQESENEKRYTFTLMSTKNFIFGSCIEDKDIYKTEYTLLLCKKLNKAYEIKHFYPKLKKLDSLDIHCKK